MRIAGFTKFSLVDYPERISCVLFTQGCNFCCFYCHNKSLIPEDAPSFIDEQMIFDFLIKRQGQVDALVITGGEPTLQADLYTFIQKIKCAYPRLLIKLDTNGSNPKLLEALISDRLIDYVAMDIKAPIDQYEHVIKAPVNKNAILKSIKLLIESNIDYEFRTTIPLTQSRPLFSGPELDQMLKLVQGAKKYYFQGDGANPQMLPLHSEVAHQIMNLSFR